MWRHPRHTTLAFLRQGQPCPWSSHRRRRRALLVGKSQGACQGPPHKLAAARELLRNPPATATSPDALRQWRDDVDRLLHLAQASPSSTRTGQRPPPGNLNADLDAAAPKPPGNARIQAGTPVAGVGCAALPDHLRTVPWPSKFRPHLPEKYDGTTNPSEFLQVYVTAITPAGGNDAVMASYFHVVLTGPARTWFMNLTPETIQS